MLICFILPAILTWIFGIWFRHMGWIKPGDLLLESVEAALEAQASGEDGKGNGFGDEGDALTRSSQGTAGAQSQGAQGAPKATA